MQQLDGDDGAAEVDEVDQGLGGVEAGDEAHQTRSPWKSARLTPRHGARVRWMLGSIETRGVAGQQEGENLEFKSGEVRPEVVAKILGTFANTSGGTLVWGFDEQKGAVVGVSDPEKAELAVRDGLALVKYLHQDEADGRHS